MRRTVLVLAVLSACGSNAPVVSRITYKQAPRPTLHPVVTTHTPSPPVRQAATPARLGHPCKSSWYAAGLRHPDADCRFDVLLLDSLEAGRIKWIRNAFTA